MSNWIFVGFALLISPCAYGSEKCPCGSVSYYHRQAEVSYSTKKDLNGCTVFEIVCNCITEQCANLTMTAYSNSGQKLTYHNLANRDNIAVSLNCYNDEGWTVSSVDYPAAGSLAGTDYFFCSGDGACPTCGKCSLTTAGNNAFLIVNDLKMLDGCYPFNLECVCKTQTCINFNITFTSNSGEELVYFPSENANLIHAILQCELVTKWTALNVNDPSAGSLGDVVRVVCNGDSLDSTSTMGDSTVSTVTTSTAGITMSETTPGLVDHCATDNDCPGDERCSTDFHWCVCFALTHAYPSCEAPWTCVHEIGCVCNDSLCPENQTCDATEGCMCGTDKCSDDQECMGGQCYVRRATTDTVTTTATATTTTAPSCRECGEIATEASGQGVNLFEYSYPVSSFNGCPARRYDCLCMHDSCKNFKMSVFSKSGQRLVYDPLQDTRIVSFEVTCDATATWTSWRIYSSTGGSLADVNRIVCHTESCADIATNCPAQIAHCTKPLFLGLMSRNCALTCGYCP